MKMSLSTLIKVLRISELSSNSSTTLFIFKRAEVIPDERVFLMIGFGLCLFALCLLLIGLLICLIIRLQIGIPQRSTSDWTEPKEQDAKILESSHSAEDFEIQIDRAIIANANSKPASYASSTAIAEHSDLGLGDMLTEQQRNKFHGRPEDYTVSSPARPSRRFAPKLVDDADRQSEDSRRSLF